MKTKDEIFQLASGIMTGAIYAVNNIKDIEASFRMVFMFMSQEQLDNLMSEKPVLFYAPMTDAGPRQINGKPQFFSLAYLTEDEAKEFWPVYEKMKSAVYGTS